MTGAMVTENIQGKKIEGFGRCIYCGSDGGAEGLGSKAKKLALSI